MCTSKDGASLTPTHSPLDIIAGEGYVYTILLVCMYSPHVLRFFHRTAPIQPHPSQVEWII